MQTAASAQRILVKARPGLDRVASSLGGSSIDFEAGSLFESVGRVDAFGVESGKPWYVRPPAIAFDEPNVWDLCHSVMREGFGVPKGTPEFAEPDIQPRWIVGEFAGLGVSAARTCEAQNGHKPSYPTARDPLWFRDRDHCRLEGQPLPAPKESAWRILMLVTIPTQQALRRHRAHLGIGRFGRFLNG